MKGPFVSRYSLFTGIMRLEFIELTCQYFQLGREEPAISMDSLGKIIWAKHNEIQSANVKASPDDSPKDGERIRITPKELGSCEVYPQSLQHTPNGRFVVVCGDGEYIIYTALAWRNKSFGNALEFVWAQNSNEYVMSCARPILLDLAMFTDGYHRIVMPYANRRQKSKYSKTLKSKPISIFDRHIQQRVSLVEHF